MFTVELFLQTLIAGVIIGVLYALMALGITFIYSIVKMINWAMGEFYMIGGYLQYLLIVEWLGADLWWVAAPLSALWVFLLGYRLEPLLIKPMFTTAVERKDDYAIVVTIALLLMLRNLAAALGGPYQRTPGSNLPTVMLGPLPESGARFAAFLCALAAIALFYLLLKKTWLGLALRAAAQSRIGAQTAGVDVFRLDQIAFGIGVGLAGLAGALLAPVFMVFPTSGVVTTVKGFEIIVIGGLGSIPGALIAGVLLGVVESLGASFISAPYQNVYGFLLVVLVLLVRPTGLFGAAVGPCRARAARNPRSHQTFRRSACHRRGRPRDRARRNPRPDRAERRRQDHAGQSHRRPLPARRRRHPARRAVARRAQAARDRAARPRAQL